MSNKKSKKPAARPAPKPTAKKIIKKQGAKRTGVPTPAPMETKVWGQAIFLLTPQLFLKFFHGRVAYEVSENPIPPDAKIVDIRMDKWNKRNDGGIIEVLVSHHSIAPVEDGKELPMFKAPKFTRMEIQAPAAGVADEPVAGL